MKGELVSTVKVFAVGTVGSYTAWKLADVATVVSILVGVCSIGYICTQWYFLIRNKGRKPTE